MKPVKPLRDAGGGLAPLGFYAGARFALGGISFTFRHKRLIALSIVPMLVQVALFIALLIGGVALIDVLLGGLRPEPGHWYSFIGKLEWLIAAVIMVIMAVLLSLMIGSVVCDPFYDVLSEVTESLLLGRDVSQPTTVNGLVGGIFRELLALPWKLGLYALVAGPLWLLSLTGVGSVVAVPLTLAWTWMFVALSGLSRSLSRHAVPGRRRLIIIFTRPTVALGFGAVGWALSHIPLTYPFLVVGGTRLHLSLAAHDRLDSNLTPEDKLALRGPEPT